MSDRKDSWSDCGQVFFCDGYAWGLTENLSRICLGTEEEVKETFITHKIKEDLHPRRRQVLSQILEYREVELGTGTTGMERTGINGTIGRNKGAIRPTKIGKRAPLRPTKSKNPYISGR